MRPIPCAVVGLLGGIALIVLIGWCVFFSAGLSSEGDRPVYVRIERFTNLDAELKIGAFNRANLSIKDSISEYGETSVVACFIAPSDLEWVRITVFYVDPKMINPALISKIENFKPYPYK